MRRPGVLLFEPDAALGTGALLMLILGVISAAVPERLPVFCAFIVLFAFTAHAALKNVITVKRAVIAGSIKTARLSGAVSVGLVCAALCAAYLMPVIIMPPLCFCVLPPAMEFVFCAAAVITAFLSLLCSVAALIEHGSYAGAVLSTLMVFFAIPVMN